MNAEQARLEEAREQTIPWRKWGPYLSERQWGTVREDYSEGGNAWDYFSHDQARSRAYRWGEDGLAGISDDKQRLCFALALWNGKDPILKERLFGLTNTEGNHGEDVKEYYFYLDSTPTHSYMKYLYKYPQAAFPYADLVETSKQREPRPSSSTSCSTPASSTRTATSTCSSSTPRRRPRTCWSGSPSTTAAPRRPTCTSCRRCGSATSGRGTARPDRPDAPAGRRRPRPAASCRPPTPALGERYLYCEGDAPLLFTENETNTQRIFGVPNRIPYVKDGINNYVVHGQDGAVNPEKTGTKVAAHYRLTVPAGRVAGDPAAALGRRPGGARPGQRPKGSPFGDAFDARDRGPAEGGRRVLRGRHPGRASTPTRPTSCGRRWPACCGASSSTTTTWTSGSRSAAPTRSRRTASRRRATTTGTTCTTATSSRCRTSGSTPGTPPGTSPSTSWP